MSAIDDFINAGRGVRRRGLNAEEQDAIDGALFDVYRAAWEADRDVDAVLMRAAYLQGRVDEELGRPRPVQCNANHNPTGRRP